MIELGNGLTAAKYHEEALSVREAELFISRRLGATESHFLLVQGNLAMTYEKLGRVEEALPMRRDVYSGSLKLHGEESEETLTTANNYANCLFGLKRFEEAKALYRKIEPVARRVLGENNDLTIRMRMVYASALYIDTDATLDDLREAVTTLEDTARTARQVLGGTHPLTTGIDGSLQSARAALAARDGDDASSVCEAVRKAKV